MSREKRGRKPRLRPREAQFLQKSSLLAPAASVPPHLLEVQVKLSPTHPPDFNFISDYTGPLRTVLHRKNPAPLRGPICSSACLSLPRLAFSVPVLGPVFLPPLPAGGARPSPLHHRPAAAEPGSCASPPRWW